jgi:hypothetical protein
VFSTSAAVLVVNLLQAMLRPVRWLRKALTR